MLKDKFHRNNFVPEEDMKKKLFELVSSIDFDMQRKNMFVPRDKCQRTEQKHKVKKS